MADHLFSIAINRYAEWGPLQGPVVDQETLCEVLVDPYGFAPGRVVRLRDEEATAAAVMRQFRAYRDLAPGDRLIIAFSGHGYTDDFDKTGYWIPCDGSMDRDARTHWMANAHLRNILAHLPAKHVLLLSDACFSGDLLDQTKDIGLLERSNLDRAEELTSREVLTSGASEVVPDVGIGEHSPFMHHVLDTLRRREHEWIDPLRLYDRVRSGVRLQQPLYGTLPGAGHQQGGAFLLWPKTPLVAVGPEVVAEKEISIDSFAGKKAGEMKRHGLGMKFRWCPPGEFWMGSPEGETGRDDDEVLHRVELTKGFWIGELQVTQGDWQAVMGRSLREQVKKALLDETLYRLGGKSQTLRDFWGVEKDADPTLLMTSEGNDYPITFVNWEEAQEFCQRLTERERGSGRLPAGWGYRLPTEAQWEYACRAGTSTALYSGPLTIKGENDGPELDEIAWYGGNSSEGRSGSGWDTKDWSEKQYPGGLANTRKGGQKRANSWGLHDMIGNVWEWCEDWYGSYSQDFVVDPNGPPKGRFRVLRGGGWNVGARFCRSAYRYRDVPSDRGGNDGFRLSLQVQNR